MCGIVGFSGNISAEDVIITGLKKMEYRGYDSAGISLVDEDGNINTIKRVGKLENLMEALKGLEVNSTLGIGHTRWATHGEPSERNAHPQNSNDGNFSIVHNGIIENYMELKEMLISKGFTFTSDTDTEIIVNLLQYNYKNNVEEAFKKTLSQLKGQYAIGMVSNYEKDTLYAAKFDAPLILGVSKNGYIITSDVASILNYTKECIYIDNDEYAVIKKDEFKIYDKLGRKLAKKVVEINWSEEQATKEGFDHFMLKEIFEQPTLISHLMSNKTKDDLPHLEHMFTKEELENFDSVYIVGCGTAFHAGEVGKFLIENWVSVPVTAEIASEFRYKTKFVTDKSLVIFVSQSGETADTIAALKAAKLKGATTLAITNVVGSSITREANVSIYCDAGPEISVASTKAYTTQLVVFYLLALQIAKELGTMEEHEIKSIIKEMKLLSGKIEVILSNLDVYKEIAKTIKDKDALFYIGRGLDYFTVKEGALKLKEITYIFTEAFPAGELKHGPLALIEKGTPVIAVLAQQSLMDKTISNIKEVKARGAYVVGIAPFGAEKIKDVCDSTIFFPTTHDFLTPITAAVPEQLIAYFTSLAKGIDVDKPRNLAKSVTVE